MATPIKGRGGGVAASTPGRAVMTPPKTPTTSQRSAAAAARARANTPSHHARPRSDDQGAEGIQVAIRMRPLNKNEGSHSRVWKVLPKYMSVAQTTAEGKPMPERVAGRNFFTFDKTFGEDCSTQKVYDNVAKNIVGSVCTGLNGTIFAYGQTSSGKTYTMQGSGTIAEGSAGTGGGGVVHMAAQDVFSHIEQHQDRIFLVRASFLEIYNEEVRDLLADNKVLQVREDPRRGVFVQSKEEIVTDFNSLLGILFEGEKSRAFASTAMNERSSRSHTIFRVTIESREKSEGAADDETDAGEGGDGAVRVSTLNLVDLAGSESVRHTGATGDRQKEGGMINQSLLTLSRVIVALGVPNQTHINFRDSKLTRILQPSLSGNARMAVVCCATPSELYLEETRSTLLFASRAKLVKTNAQVNEVLDDRSIIRRLQRELAEARRNGGGAAATEHVRTLEHNAATAENAAKVAEEKLKRVFGSILNNGGALFGDVDGPKKPFKRRRRLSEGSLLVAGPTPTPPHHTREMKLEPSTVPRTTRSVFDKKMSLSSELSLLREALTTKSESMSALMKQFDEASRTLQEKESELVAANCSNDILLSDRDKASEESSSLSVQLSELRSELEAASLANEKLMKEKDSAIAEALSKLEKELADRHVLEETVDTLQESKLSLERELSDQQTASKDQISALQNRLETRDQELESQTALTTSLEAQLDKTKSELSSTKTSLEERSVELKDCTQKLENAEESLRSCKSDLEQSLEQGRTMNTAHEETLKEKRQLEDEIAVLKQESADTVSLLRQEKESNAALGNQAETLKNSIDSLELQLTTTKANLANVENDRDETVSTLETTKGLLASAQVKIEEMNESQIALSSSNETLQAKLSSAIEEQNSLRSELADKNELLTASQTKIDDLTRSVEAMEGDKTLAASNLAELENQSGTLKNTVASLEQELTTVKSSLVDTEKERDSFFASLETTKESLEAAQIKIEAMNEAQHTLESGHEALQTELLSLTEGRDSARKELSANVELLTEAQSKIVEMTANVEELSTNFTKANHDLQDLREENSATVQKLELLQAKHDETVEELTQRQKQTCDLETQLASVTIERDVVTHDAKKTAISLKEACVKVEGLAVVLSQSEEDKSAMDTKLGRLEDEKNAAVTRFKQLEAESAQARSDLEFRLTTVSTERDVARTETVAANESIARAQTKIQGLAVVLGQSEADKEVMSHQLATFQQDNSLALTRLDELENARNDLESNLAAITSELTVAKQQVATSKKGMDVAQTKVEGLTVVLSQTEGSLCAMSTNRDSLLEELETSRLAVAASQVQLDELTASKTVLETEKAALLSTIQTHSECIDKGNAQIAELELRLTQRDEKVAEGEAKFLSLTDQLALSQSELETVRGQLQEKALIVAELESVANTKEAELRSFLSDMESGNESSAAKLQDALEDRDKTNSILAQTNKELGELRDLVNELQEKVVAVTEERDASRTELKASTESIANAQKEVQQLTDTLDILRAEKAAADESLSKTQEEASSASIRVESLGNRVTELNEVILGLKNQIGALERDVNAATEQRDTALSDLATANNSLSSLQLRIDELESGRQALIRETENTAASQKETMESLVAQTELWKAEERTLRGNLLSAQQQIESLSRKQSSVESELSNKSQDLQSARDELLSMHDVLESTNAQCNELKQKVNDLEDELESKETMMSGFAVLEAERDSLAKNLTEAQSKQHGMARLETEAQELKQLLASANESVSEARAAAKSAQLETENKDAELDAAYERLSKMEEELNNATNFKVDQSGFIQTDVENRLQDAVEQKRQSDLLLEKERADREKSEAELKRRMADEQRLLIKEAEQSMQDLREKLSCAQVDLKKSEAEAYAAREMKEGLEDQNKRYLDQSIQLESRIAALENENTRLRRASNRQDTGKDSELSSLKANLQRLKADQSIANAAIAELEKKLEDSQREKQNIQDSLSAAEKALARIDAQGLESEIRRLNSETEKLQNDLEASRAAVKENIGSGAELVSLRAKCSELTEQIAAKDKRIQKLEKSKLTKENISKIKKMKADHAASVAEVKATKAALAEMQLKLAESSREDSQVTKLRFDKEALENKLRKFASHSQRLEDERAGILQALRSANPDEIANDDIEQAVAALCDRLTSLEKEYDSIANSERRVSSSLGNSSLLQVQLTESQQQIDRLRRSESELKEAVFSLQQELRGLAERPREDAESSRQLRYLEQENLQLMVDLKAAKKNLQNAKSELNMLRAQGASTGLDAVPRSIAKSKKTPNKQASARVASKPTRTPANKENSNNKIAGKHAASSSAQAKQLSSSQKVRRRTPGLGEVFAGSEENTQECKQS